MLRSLMTAVTGVRAHQTMLDVTGNNIANANTTGFKKDFTVFADLMYQASKYASSPSENRGGVNPAQVGLGVSVAAIETIHTQGSASYTGNPSDMMVQDSGFFVYRNGDINYYSRSGATVRDANSDLVQSGTGYLLQGYKIEEDPLNPSSYVRASELSNVNIPLGRKLEARATTEVQYQCNLDSRSSAYLPYGFADLPYNAYCGWDGNPTGTAKVTMKDKEYDLSFQTDLTSSDGTNYMYIEMAQGANTARINFDMVSVNNDGTPQLALSTGTDSIVGYIVNGAFQTDAPDADNDETGTPVFQFPGSTPATYFTAEYDDTTGELKLRDLTFYDDDGNELTDGTTSETVVANPTVFKYNMKENMNYSSFVLEGASTDDDGNATVVSYRVIAEFDESVTSQSNPASDLARSSSTLTMWYLDNTDEDEANWTIKKMQANVFFNADGTFDSVEWPNGEEANMPNAGALFNTTNFRINADGETLSFQTAQNLESPGDSWDTLGSIYEGGYHSTKKTIYDCDGNEHTLEVNFKKVTENRWRWEAFLLDSEGNTSNITPTPSSGEIEFCGCGPVCNAVTGDSSNTRKGNNNSAYPNAEVEINIPFSLNGVANSTVKLNFGGDGDAMMGVTQFASETTTKPIYQDGYAMGVLESYSIAQDGTVTGSYSNGKNIPMYRIALATFANEQGLEKIGNTMFRETTNSGVANIDPAEVNGKGTIMAQYLEMSNVDLTEEFTHLIIAQRGFQANTRVITTSDQILEEVVNLKR